MRHFSEALAAAMGSTPDVCPACHLPVAAARRALAAAGEHQIEARAGYVPPADPMIRAPAPTPRDRWAASRGLHGTTCACEKCWNRGAPMKPP